MAILADGRFWDCDCSNNSKYARPSFSVHVHLFNWIDILPSIVFRRYDKGLGTNLAAPFPMSSEIQGAGWGGGSARTEQVTV